MIRPAAGVVGGLTVIRANPYVQLSVILAEWKRGIALGQVRFFAGLDVSRGVVGNTPDEVPLVVASFEGCRISRIGGHVAEEARQKEEGSLKLHIGKVSREVGDFRRYVEVKSQL